MAIKYPAYLIKLPDGSYSATFPDLPEAAPATGADIEDTLREGRRAFLKALPLFILDNDCLPRPSAKHPRYSITLTLDDMIVSLPHEQAMVIKDQPEPQAVSSEYAQR